MVSIFASFGDLDNQIKIFGVDSCGKNAEDASGGKVLSSECSEGSDSGGEVLIFFFLKVHVLSGGLVFFGVGRAGVSVDERPVAVIVVDVMSLETLIVVSERKSV